MCIHFKKKKKTICKQPQFLVKKRLNVGIWAETACKSSRVYGTGNQSKSILYKLAEKIHHIPTCVGGCVCVCCKKKPRKHARCKNNIKLFIVVLYKSKHTNRRH